MKGAEFIANKIQAIFEEASSWSLLFFNGCPLNWPFICLPLTDFMSPGKSDGHSKSFRSLKVQNNATLLASLLAKSQSNRTLMEVGA